MRKILSLEASRPALLDPTSTFVDDVTTLGREIFDTNGRSAVAFRPSNRVVRAVRNGMEFPDDSGLRYCHFNAAGIDAKHLGEKVFRVLKRLDAEPGPRTDIFNELRTPLEQRAGREPLAATLDAVAEQEYDFDPDEMPVVSFDEIEAVEYPMLVPGKKLFVLRAGKMLGRSAASMYCRMSQVTELAVQENLRREAELERGPLVDGVMIAATRSMDLDKIELFKAHVGELLPIRAQLGPVELSASL